MADDRHYVPGDFYRIDDRSGFKVRAKRTRKEWTGLIVDQDKWEARPSQDFVKGVIDDQTVPEPRPRQPDRYIGVGTAQFQVFCDNPLGKTFLVMNQNSGAYDPGINADSNFTNPTGGAQFWVTNGTIAAVTPASFGSNIS